jgi:glycosidase
LRNRRFGGDFKGIESKITYLQDLWIDIVLLHPIWLSDSSMRYDVKDWRHIDPRLTSEYDNRIHSYTDYTSSWYADTWDFTQSDKEFFKFIDEFHDKWIRVVLDMSLLYISSTNYLIKDVALRGKNSPYYEWFDFTEKQYKDDNQSCDLSFFYNTKDYPGVENISYQWWWWDCSKIYIRRWVGKKSIPDWLYEYYIRILERRLW